MSTSVKMVIANWPYFAKGLVAADKRALQFMRREMKRGANRIRKLFISEQLRGRPGIKAGKLAKGKNVWTHVQGDTTKNITGSIGISRILRIHEFGATISGRRRPDKMLYLRANKAGKGAGKIIAVVPTVVIPARLRFRELVARESPKVLAKVAAEGERAVALELSGALKKTVARNI